MSAVVSFDHSTNRSHGIHQKTKVNCMIVTSARHVYKVYTRRVNECQSFSNIQTGASIQVDWQGYVEQVNLKAVPIFTVSLRKKGMNIFFILRCHICCFMSQYASFNCLMYARSSVIAITQKLRVLLTLATVLKWLSFRLQR